MKPWMAWPERCTAEVSRNKELQPCDKPAIAVAVEAESDWSYPVCKNHARGRDMLPLRRIIELAQGRS